MEETSTRPVSILEFRQDIEAQLRQHIREALDVSLREELAAALHANRHERSEGRSGYRNGTIERTVTTAMGTRVVAVPRGRVGSVPSSGVNRAVFPEFDHGVDADAAVDGKNSVHRCLETPVRFPQASTPTVLHAIATKISWAVAGSVGAVSCFIDSALK
jgi:hypothetical protein